MASSSKTIQTRRHRERREFSEKDLLKTRTGMSRKKVTVVGGGFVGSTTAQRIVDLELADVVLTDILDGPPAGEALDIVESRPITRTESHTTGITTSRRDS